MGLASVNSAPFTDRLPTPTGTPPRIYEHHSFLAALLLEYSSYPPAILSSFHPVFQLQIHLQPSATLPLSELPWKAAPSYLSCQILSLQVYGTLLPLAMVPISLPRAFPLYSSLRSSDAVDKINTTRGKSNAVFSVIIISHFYSRTNARYHCRVSLLWQFHMLPLPQLHCKSFKTFYWSPNSGVLGLQRSHCFHFVKCTFLDLLFLEKKKKWKRNLIAKKLKETKKNFNVIVEISFL